MILPLTLIIIFQVIFLSYLRFNILLDLMCQLFLYFFYFYNIELHNDNILYFIFILCDSHPTYINSIYYGVKLCVSATLTNIYVNAIFGK